MGLIDWLIVIVPVTFVVGMGFYSRKYIRGVADFLAAGRVCGRYVIIITLLAMPGLDKFPFNIQRIQSVMASTVYFGTCSTSFSSR